MDIAQHGKDISKEIRFFDQQIKERATTGACQVNAAALEAVKNHSSQWLLDSIVELKAHYSQKVNAETVMDRIFIGSGVGLYRGRLLASNKNLKAAPPFTDQDGIMIESTHQFTLNDIIADNDIGKMKWLFGEVNQQAPSVIVGNQGFVHLFGFLLINTNSQQQVIDGYLSANLPVTYLDLVIASQLGVSTDNLNRLYQQSGLDASKRLKYLGTYTSLALESLKALKYQQAKFWLSLGSPMAPDSFHNNALDVLVINAPTDLDETWFDMAEYLLTQKLSPYWPANIKKLKSLVGDEIYARYQAQLRPFQQGLTNRQLQQAKIEIDKIHQQALASADITLQQTPANSLCALYAGKYLVSIAMRKKPRTKSQR